jgi:hypothetical protein
VVAHLLVDFAALHDTREFLEVSVLICLPGLLSGGHGKCAGAMAVRGWRDVADTYLVACIKVGDESVKTLHWGVRRPRNCWTWADIGDIGVVSRSLGGPCK